MFPEHPNLMKAIVELVLVVALIVGVVTVVIVLRHGKSNEEEETGTKGKGTPKRLKGTEEEPKGIAGFVKEIMNWMPSKNTLLAGLGILAILAMVLVGYARYAGGEESEEEEGMKQPPQQECQLYRDPQGWIWFLGSDGVRYILMVDGWHIMTGNKGPGPVMTGGPPEYKEYCIRNPEQVAKVYEPR